MTLKLTLGGSTTSYPEYDASDPEYGIAGDGETDDTEAIQDLIDHVDANGGGTVYFPRGDYIISSPITPRDNVSLDGEHARLSTIHQTDGSEHALDLKGASDLTIENLGLTHDWGLADQDRGQLIFSGSACRNVTVDSCYLYEAARQGVGFWSRSNNNIRFLNTDVEATPRGGIVIFGDHIQVDGCYVERTGDDAIALNTAGTTQSKVTGNIVVEGAGAGEQHGGGIKFHGRRILIEQNIVIDSNQYGIRGQMVDSADDTHWPTQNAVRNNLVANLTDLNPDTNASAGIEMRDFLNIIIEGNELYDLGEFDGIRIRNHHDNTTRSRVANNYIEGARFALYYKNPHDYATVVDNTIHSVDRVIHIRDSVDDLLFRDNDGSDVGRCVHFSGVDSGTYHLQTNYFAGSSTFVQGSVSGGEVRNYLNSPAAADAGVRNGASSYEEVRWSDLVA